MNISILHAIPQLSLLQYLLNSSNLENGKILEITFITQDQNRSTIYINHYLNYNVYFSVRQQISAQTWGRNEFTFHHSLLLLKYSNAHPIFSHLIFRLYYIE